MKTEEQEAVRATYSVTNKDGYSLLITIPASATGKQLQDLFTNLDAVDQMLGVNGFKPQVKASYGAKAPYVAKEKNWTGAVCPEDGGRLYTETTKTGKTFTSCENRKFDFNTKQTTGCSYIQWEKSY